MHSQGSFCHKVYQNKCGEKAEKERERGSMSDSQFNEGIVCIVINIVFVVYSVTKMGIVLLVENRRKNTEIARIALVTFEL